MERFLTPHDLDRYQRQMALPDFGAAQQKRLKNTRVLMVGAGGLGSAILTYLAGAGVGHITIADFDTVSRTNLHRQVIYKEQDIGQNKAELAAAYVQALNPDIDVAVMTERFSEAPSEQYDLLIDGSDNFETKSFLNDLSIKTQTPLLSASINRMEGMAGLFAGYLKGVPCYHCLFPELPTDACNCNEAGVLGTAAGLTGLYQAHLALLYLAGMGDVGPGIVFKFDFLNFKFHKFNLPADEACLVCKDYKMSEDNQTHDTDDLETIPLVSIRDLGPGVQIVDVREAEEIAVDPIDGALHIPIGELVLRLDELPEDKPLAFVCAANVRSQQAAEYLQALGRADICVLDKFSL